MTKALVSLLSIVGFVVVATGQTTMAPAQLSANTVSRPNAETLQLRGSVRIVVGTVVITADEADARLTGQSSPTEFDLRGHVHLTTTAGK